MGIINSHMYHFFLYDGGREVVIMKRIMKLAAAMCIALTVIPAQQMTQTYALEITDENTENPGTWRRDSTGWWLSNADGTWPAGECMRVDGDVYYFNNEGYMVTGWRKLEGDWYYFNGSGAMVMRKWLKDDGDWYYLGGDGAMYTGLKKVGSDTYYFSSSGAMLTGWVKTGGDWYYFTDSGEMKTGWLKDDGTWYFLGKDGKMLTGIQNDGSDLYYMRATGAMAYSCWISTGGNWYYAESSGALVRNRFRTVNGTVYYFDDAGKMVTGKHTINGKTYNFDSSGALMQGWVKKDGKWFYYNDEGELLKGDWYEIGRHWYYFYEDGSMAYSTVIDGYRIGPTGIYIKETKDSRGITYVNGIMIANKKHALPQDYNPGEDYTAGVQIRKMISDMRSLGYNISTGYSGFRSYSTQNSLYWNYVSRDGQAAADRYSARPGYSEHQTGLAFDLMHTSGQLVTGTAESNWIAANAHKYGFIVRYKPGTESITGYMEEPWHLRYVGEEASDIYSSGLTLEEYFCVSGGTSYN